MLPTFAADPASWGPASNGLRISISLGKPTSQEVRVALENLGERGILIPLGVRVGNPHMIFFSVGLKTANGETPKAICTGLGAIAGAVEPLTMGLRAGETYTLALLLDRLYVLDALEKCEVHQRKKVSVS